jgi:hypothetical protein
MTQGMLRTLDEIELLKSNILNHLISNAGSTLSGAAVTYGVGKATVFQWQQNDPAFKDSVRWAREINRQITNDFVESNLLRLIKEGNPSATIFYAKCRMKDRGYSEKSVAHETQPDEPIPLDQLPSYEDALSAYQEKLALAR